MLEVFLLPTRMVLRGENSDLSKVWKNPAQNTDYQAHELQKFLSLLQAGNIQFVELVLKGSREVPSNCPTELLTCWDENKPKLEDLAYKVFSNYPFGHLKGWYLSTKKKVDAQGWSVKKALLMYRVLVEAQVFMDSGRVIPRVPELLEHSSSMLFQELFKAKVTNMRFNKFTYVEVELNKMFEEVSTLAQERKTKHDLSELTGDILESFRRTSLALEET